MKLCWIALCVLTTVAFCDGSLLEGIINSAHEAAGAFLGGISGGVHFGVNGHGNQQRFPPRPFPPHRPGKPETVVVVVEDEPDEPNLGPGPHNHNGYGNNNKPHPNHSFNPNGNGHGNLNSNNYGQSGDWNNQNQQQGQYGNQNFKPNPQFPQNPNNHQNNHQQNYNHNNPNYQFGNNNDRPVNPNNQYGNNNNRPFNPNTQYGKPNNQPVNPNNQFGNNNQYVNPINEYGNSINQAPNKNPNNYGDVSRPSYSTNKPNQGRPIDQGQNTDHNIVKPPVDNTMKFPGQTNYGSYDNQNQNNEHKPDKNNNKNTVENSTKDPTGAEEYPLFLPLSPNEYQYGGEKIDVNAPKRETDNSKPKPADDDEEFPIDIRIIDT